MTAKQATWTDGLGIPTVVITADFDEDSQLVTVDRDTLETMAKAIIDSGIFSDEDAAEAATALLDTGKNDYGRYEVTEAGGGWSHWTDSVVS
jgi:hypothetical protein